MLTKNSRRKWKNKRRRSPKWRIDLVSKVPPPKFTPDVQYVYRPRANTSLNCYKCGAPGHMAKDCKVPEPRIPNVFVPRIFAPNRPLPNGFVPNGFVPNGQFPTEFVPNGQMPVGFVPMGQAPNGQIPNAAPSQAAPPPEQTNNVRPIRDKQVKTCIEVEYEGEILSALVDTGSDVSMAGDDVA